MTMRRIDFLISESQFEALFALPGTISENLRRAIDEYLKSIEAQKVSVSNSKGVKKNG
jgi:hypothetical protein